MEYTIKELAYNERPREKLVTYGSNTLNNEELMAIVLRSGIKNTNVLSIAKEILMQYDLTELDDNKIWELSKIKGVGKTKAITLIAAIELGRRSMSSNKNKIQIRCSEDIYNHFGSDIIYAKQEHLKTIFLDTKKYVIKVKTMFVGTVNASTVHPRDIFREAVCCNAVGIILIHNHPTGDVTPSLNDDTFTSKMISASKLMGIQVIDHLIVGNNKYYSYREKWDTNEK
ncbi:MAG: DNA repair protein RadC [Bacilli bacterium]